MSHKHRLIFCVLMPFFLFLFFCFFVVIRGISTLILLRFSPTTYSLLYLMPGPYLILLTYLLWVFFFFVLFFFFAWFHTTLHDPCFSYIHCVSVSVSVSFCLSFYLSQSFSDLTQYGLDQSQIAILQLISNLKRGKC